VIRALITGAGRPAFKKRLLLKTSIPALMGTRLSSELGKVKVVRKRNGAPPQLHRYQELAL